MMVNVDDVTLESKTVDAEKKPVVDELGLRHRVPWTDRVTLNNDVPRLKEVDELFEDDDVSCLEEVEDGVGCPLPSTPEDDHLLDCEVCFIFIINNNNNYLALMFD